MEWKIYFIQNYYYIIMEIDKKIISLILILNLINVLIDRLFPI